MILGILMFLNVWGVIWRNQKVVLANAANALDGEEPVPGAADAGRGRCSPPGRTSSSRCRCCGSWSARALLRGVGFAARGSAAARWPATSSSRSLIIAVLEINALGLLGTKPGTATLWPYESHRNAIISAFVLWAIFWLITELFFAA